MSQLTRAIDRAAALALLPLGVAAFFPDPDPRPDHRQVAPDLVVEPADGKVMSAALPRTRLQSVFLPIIEDCDEECGG